MASRTTLYIVIQDTMAPSGFKATPQSIGAAANPERLPILQHATNR